MGRGLPFCLLCYCWLPLSGSNKKEGRNSFKMKTKIQMKILPVTCFVVFLFFLVFSFVFFLFKPIPFNC